MIKRRARPPPNLRQKSLEVEEEQPEQEEVQEGDAKLDLSDLIELRKLRRTREGIDVQKLTKGDAKKRKKRPREGEPEDQGGLRKGAVLDDDDGEEEDAETRARRVVRANNFTQQTNTLDVDKHMMAYIEENMKLRQGAQNESEKDDGPLDPYAELFRIADKYKPRQDSEKEKEEGSVTNSLSMLTAIPEVDLGMDTRLKNIEETEKAKRLIEERKERKKQADDEAHLAATRFYRPNLKTRSDADIIRDAKLEAMGLPPEDHDRPRHDRPQMATDEMVMERFKKRMRK
ncbi:hypothetical protein CERSUDRAFT_148439 [Gelatoporia subvermispora B]|uniref:Hepatocellular carcinoma-associated antigen 59-domain-containing protein n=1 Tax=Ceriporiopsis subvermispora (strain B) TaxID=914234 RepID=M2QTR5_CERS8|nr:hypothetical protein CERSUDRAFT_148439 [Gelatoporia subvermispora B]